MKVSFIVFFFLLSAASGHAAGNDDTRAMVLAGQDGEGTPLTLKAAGELLTSDSLEEEAFLEAIAVKPPPTPFTILALESQKKQALAFEKKLNLKQIAARLMLVPDDALLTEEMLLKGQGTAKTLAAFSKLSEDEQRRSLEKVSATGELINRNRQRFVGSIQLAYRLKITLGFFAMGMSPEAALSLMSIQSFLTYYFNFHQDKVDRFFKNRLFGQPGQSSARAEWFKRFGLEVFLKELYRGISGPIGDAHSILTLQGQIEVWANLLASDLGWATLMTARNRAYDSPGRQWQKSWLSFNAFTLGTYFEVANLFGVSMGRFGHLGPLPITGTLLTLLALYFGPPTLLNRSPQVFDGIHAFEEKYFLKIYKKFVDFKARNDFCKLGLSDLTE